MTNGAGMTNEDAARRAIVRAARSLFERGLTHGSTGNISVRVGERILITPTGSSLGTVEADDLAVIDEQGAHRDGPPPSKEAFLHAALLRARPGDGAVVHTHSTHAAAVSCLDGLDADNALPPLTAYYAMRIGTLPLLPYHAPGDTRLTGLVEAAGHGHHALLLANHGPVVAAPTLARATDAAEELEETAKLFFLLAGHPTRPLTPAQVAALGR